MASKNKKWIQKATASIKKRGTEGVCTGEKFGSSSCPPGSKRYNLAKTFKKMAKKRPGGGPIGIDPSALALGPGSFLGAPDLTNAGRPVDPKNIDQVWNSYGHYVNSLIRQPGTEPQQIKGFHVGIKDKSGQFYYLPKKEYDRLYTSEVGSPTNNYSLGGAIALGSNLQRMVGSGAQSLGNALIGDDTEEKRYLNENLLGNIGNPIGMLSGLIGYKKHMKDYRNQQAQEQFMQGELASQEIRNNQPSYTPTFPMGGLIPYANAELEKEEVVQTPQGEMVTIDAPSHSEGGVDIVAPEGSRVYSDRLKPKGSKETYAQMADKIKKQIEKYEKILNS